MIAGDRERDFAIGFWILAIEEVDASRGARLELGPCLPQRRLHGVGGSQPRDVQKLQFSDVVEGQNALPAGHLMQQIRAHRHAPGF